MDRSAGYVRIKGLAGLGFGVELQWRRGCVVTAGIWCAGSIGLYMRDKDVAHVGGKGVEIVVYTIDVGVAHIGGKVVDVVVVVSA